MSASHEWNQYSMHVNMNTECKSACTVSVNAGIIIVTPITTARIDCADTKNYQAMDIELSCHQDKDTETTCLKIDRNQFTTAVYRSTWMLLTRQSFQRVNQKTNFTEQWTTRWRKLTKSENFTIFWLRARPLAIFQSTDRFLKGTRGFRTVVPNPFYGSGLICDLKMFCCPQL